MFVFLKQRKNIDIYSPVDGTIVELSKVPDPVFSQRIVGDGVALDPTSDVILSPVDGEVILLFSTYHALGIKTKEGLEILIHIGVDTVELKGKGFSPLIKQGDKVWVGTPLVNVDFARIESLGKSRLTPIILTNADVVESLIKKNGTVSAGVDPVMTVTLK